MACVTIAANDIAPSADAVARYVLGSIRPALATLAGRLESVAWEAAAINGAVKETLAAHGLKMAQLAPAVRVVVCGRAQTPSLDTVLALFPRATVLERLRDLGAAVVQDPETDQLLINEEYRAVLVLSRCLRTDAGSSRWLVRVHRPRPRRR